MKAERMERIALDALNKAHESFGIKEIMKCKFCTSKANEMTVVKAIQQATREERAATIAEVADWLDHEYQWKPSPTPKTISGAANELRQRRLNNG